MLLKKAILAAMLLPGVCTPALLKAQEAELGPAKPKKFYVGNSFDGAILSTSIMEKAGLPDELTPIRFTYFLNLGFNFHYDFSEFVGLYTGIGIKNIGFIEKYPAMDSTVKRRAYVLGVPLGVKIGALDKKTYGFLGGGVDFPFHYKEKGFVKRGDKDKFGEWFSDRTETVMPYAFIGFSLNPIFFKVQYYPSNFLNQGYTETVNGITTAPYGAYEKTNLILLSVGFDIHYNKNSNPPIYMNQRQKEKAMGEM